MTTERQITEAPLRHLSVTASTGSAADMTFAWQALEKLILEFLAGDGTRENTRKVLTRTPQYIIEDSTNVIFASISYESASKQTKGE